MTCLTSVLILTFNEEVNIERCLDSLHWCDDIVILDSFSTDSTERLVKKYNVRFYQRDFDDYASQRNYGLNLIEYKHSWLLMVDADEEVTAELSKEIERTLEAENKNICLFRMRRKDHLFGTWIRRSSGYPTWFGRLMKIGHVKIERAINEEYITSGEIGHLKEHLFHYPFGKGFAYWLERHNRYSSMEAEFICQGGLIMPKVADFLNRDPVVRRKAIKNFVYRMPFKSAIMFFSLYILRRGFLDGRAGFVFCMLRSFYEFFISCKVKELQINQKSQLP